MNTPEEFSNQPPILPDRNIPEEWPRLITDFLGGNMNTNQKGSLKEKIKTNPGFQTFVGGLAATEVQLATLLAESRYQHATPKEPPAWAMERLRGAVAQITRINLETNSGLARFLNWLAMPRLVLAGSALALAALLLVVLPRYGDRSPGLAADAPEIKELLELSPEVFLASVGAPNVVRSAGRHLYSPSGITSQTDPIVVLSPDWRARDMKIEVSAPGNPDTMPLEGTFKGSPEPLSKIIRKEPGLQPGTVYQIRVITQGKTISEETFRISDRADGHIPPNPSAVLRAALEAVNDVPSRPGDALGLLAQLPKKYQNDQAVIRVRYKALSQIGALSEAEQHKSQIR